MRADMRSVVVIGAGQAGCQVAVSLRERDHRGPITVVGEEGVAPYRRPPLSKSYLTGATDAAGLLLREDSYFSAHGVELVRADPATSIDRRAHTVALRSGRVLPYEDLVLATGARPRELPGAHVLRTIADADALRARLLPGVRVVVIGAGFVGLEFAAVARSLGHDVVVVEAQPRALARSVSARTAEHVVAEHRARGVRVLLGTAVAAVHADRVELADGTELPADLVVAGIGVLPAVELARAAGLEVGDGIVVDAHLRTADPAIHAVGDCASFSCVATGTRLRLESVQNAADQAACVAAGILGSAEPYTAVPWFWSDQYAMKVQIAGLTAGSDRTVVHGDPDTGRFSVFCFRGDVLLGVESVNRPADFVLARRLLASGAGLVPATVASAGFTLHRPSVPAG